MDGLLSTQDGIAGSLQGFSPLTQAAKRVY